MLTLLNPPTACRVTLVTSDGVHVVATEIPHGQVFDPVALSAYGDFEIAKIETFPPRYRWIGMFAHIFDCDQDGEPITVTVSFPADGKPSRRELSKVKASHTGYRLIDHWLVDDNLGEF